MRLHRRSSSRGARRIVLTFAACAALGGALARDLSARPIDPLEFSFVRTPDVVAQRGPVSLQEAIAIARQRYRGGRVVRAETTQRNGRRVHEVRILVEGGRVRTVVIDADGGQGQ